MIDQFLIIQNLTLDQIDKLVKILAILAGGVGAYYKFFKGRVHVSRLELKVTGSLICLNDVSYLCTTASVKNIGLSKVDIDHEESGLRVTSTPSGTRHTAAQLVEWTDASVFDVFEDDPWVEPGETVEERYLIAIPGCDHEHLAFRLQLRIVSKHAYWQVNGIAQWEGKN